MSRAISIVVIFCVSSPAFADIIHVPTDAQTIQIAISKAAPFDTIIVSPGTYFEAISFGGKVITVQSTNPNDPAVVAATVINAGGLGSVVTFSGGEDQANTILDGFTVTGGTIGIDAHSSRAVIRHCIIRNNTSHGVYQADGTIEDCTITNNGSHGLIDCDGLIQRCSISYNNGSGVVDCDGSISDSNVEHMGGNGIQDGSVNVVRCHIAWNGGIGVGYRHMGNIDQSNIIGNLRGIEGQSSDGGLVRNSVIAGNRAGGFYSSRKNVLSCTVAGNKQFGFNYHSGTIQHVILWDNELGPLQYSTTPAFSGSTNPFFVEPGYWDLLNNVWIDGDYHITPDSPFIDAGSPTYGSNPNNPTTDLDGNPRIAGARVDIGAYEFQAECTGDDFDGDGKADPCDNDIDGDGISNVSDACDYSPKDIPVGPNGRPLADLNNDCKVDLRDFAEFQKSLAGP